MITLVNGVETDQVSVADRGFQYGDGLFETIAVYHATPLLWSGHMQRLRRGCARLQLDMPDEALLLQEVVSVAGEAERAVVKITVTHGPAGRGYARVPWSPPTRVVSARHWPKHPAMYARDGVAVRWCRTTLARSAQLAGIKHLNRLPQVMARAEWAEDYAEGLMCDEAGFVIEGTMSNVFAVTGDTLITPDLSQSGVAGVMRAEVLRAADRCGLPWREDRIGRTQLESADELFLTNSIIGVWPIRILATRSYTIGQATHTIQKTIEAAQCFAPAA
jgi:4-amino-4-deoxychorismate lyase